MCELELETQRPPYMRHTCHVSQKASAHLSITFDMFCQYSAIYYCGFGKIYKNCETLIDKTAIVFQTHVLCLELCKKFSTKHKDSRMPIRILIIILASFKQSHRLGTLKYVQYITNIANVEKLKAQNI